MMRSIRVLSLDGLKKFIIDQKGRGKKVGLALGCFDMVHVGHAKHFKAAKCLCDTLIVAVTKNSAVNKGPGRPVIDENDRAEILMYFEDVDLSLVNTYDSAIDLIDHLRPSVYIKGDEYYKNPELINPNFLKESEFCASHGIEVAFTMEETRSSTAIFKRIIQS